MKRHVIIYRPAHYQGEVQYATVNLGDNTTQLAVDIYVEGNTIIVKYLQDNEVVTVRYNGFPFRFEEWG